jgi:predicted nuclease of predicted toxin-antitoxin system
VTRLLADENIPQESIESLRKYGYDVAAAVEVAAGSSDIEVLRLAEREDRVLVTFDLDFGELIFRRRLAVPPGVVLLRFVPSHPTTVSELLHQLIDNLGIQLSGQFTVISGDPQQPIRQRLMPGSHPGV